MIRTSGGPAAIRVLVIDERTLVREGVRLILSADPVFDLIAMVDQLDAGVTVARETHPDVVLVELPAGAAGREFVRSLRSELPDPSLVMLTDVADAAALSEALREGAAAYVDKDARAEEVRSTIRSAVPRWQAWADPATAGSARDAPPPLTHREEQVLARIAEGKPNRVIARELGITSETVKTHVKRVMGKLRVESRTEAAVVALTTGMVQAGPATAVRRAPVVPRRDKAG